MQKSPLIQFYEVPLLRTMGSEDMRELKTHIKEKIYSKGDILHLAGEMCGEIFILREGRVKVFCNSSAGREQILDVLGSGDTCACNPGHQQWCCTTTAQALTDCVVWSLPREIYIRLLNSDVKVAKSLNTLFAGRLQKYSSLVENVMMVDPQHRLVKFILDITHETQHNPKLNIAEFPFTHEEISQRLGLVRETVTRHLLKLKKDGLISIKSRKISVHDRKKLQSFLV